MRAVRAFENKVSIYMSIVYVIAIKVTTINFNLGEDRISEVDQQKTTKW